MRRCANVSRDSAISFTEVGRVVGKMMVPPVGKFVKFRIHRPPYFFNLHKSSLSTCPSLGFFNTLY
jgi:hypothetical protein